MACEHLATEHRWHRQSLAFLLYWRERTKALYLENALNPKLTKQGERYASQVHAMELDARILFVIDLELRRRDCERNQP